MLRIELIGYQLEIHEGDPAKGESRFAATVPALPTVVAVGETMDELRDSAIKGIALMIDELNREGRPVPSPAVG
jgi:predicted RNase H-like HicB family nuclease